jgi:hypothetical protein
MPTATEHKTVRSRILQYAREIGWTYMPRPEAEARRAFDPFALASVERARKAPLFAGGFAAPANGREVSPSRRRPCGTEIAHQGIPSMKNEPQSQMLLYQTTDGATRLEVRLEDETVWLTQNQMAELFQTSIPNISMHIRNVFAEGELQPVATVKEFLIVRQKGTGKGPAR